MAFDNNFIDELKMNVNIVDVVGRTVNLKKAGANYKGLCPFHSEKTPSFMVNEEKQIFNCFGCGEKGDVIAYVEKYYKLPFMEAVEQLCNEYGIKMPEKKSGPKIDYEKYYDINAKAARFFFKSLTAGPNNGYSYCKKRSLSDETIKKFGLGYAPSDGTSLCTALLSDGATESDLLKLGLAKNGKNGVYDYFRDRLIFPIFNTSGKVIGFGGRALGDYKPKYLNSQESDIFLKKNNLFALNFTKSDIQDADQILVVEGYMDAISLYQNGVKNVVASLGTALTDNQAKLLTRYSKNVVLSYDSDNAGINAALRGIGVVTNAGGKVKILTVNDGKDPDEFIKQHGKDEFLKLVDNAVPATDFRLNIMKKGFNLKNNLEVLDYIRKIVPILRSLSPVEQDIYIKKLSEEFGISEHAIALEVQTENVDRSRYSTGTINTVRSQVKDDNRNLRVEMAFLILAMNNTRYLNRIAEDSIHIESTLGKKLYAVLSSLADSTENGTHRIDGKDVFRALDPEDEANLKRYIEIIKLGPDDEAFYQECRSNYLLNEYLLKRMELQNKLEVAEKMENSDEIVKLAAELMKLNNEITAITEEH